MQGGKKGKKYPGKKKQVEEGRLGGPNKRTSTVYSKPFDIFMCYAVTPSSVSDLRCASAVADLRCAVHHRAGMIG